MSTGTSVIRLLFATMLSGVCPSVANAQVPNTCSPALAAVVSQVELHDLVESVQCTGPSSLNIKRQDLDAERKLVTHIVEFDLREMDEFFVADSTVILNCGKKNCASYSYFKGRKIDSTHKSSQVRLGAS